MATSSVSPMSNADSWCYSKIKLMKCSYMWKIENFSLCSEDTGQFLRPSTFSARGTDTHKWSLHLYPKGHNEDSKEYISLFLLLGSCEEKEVSATYKFSVLNEKGEKTNVNKVKTPRKFLLREFRGFSKLIRREIVLDETNGLLSGDTLTIFCEVDIYPERVNISGHINALECKIRECRLSDDLGTLFENREFSDVILCVDGCELHAHKAILAARSPVFRAMFAHEMAERKSNRVEIVDVDQEVLSEMLRFIYTGKTPNLEQMAGELLEAADKYGLERLREQCEEALCTKLCVENAADTLVLADLHSADQLKALVMDYINMHAAEVVETKGWESMMKSHPHLIKQSFAARAK